MSYSLQNNWFVVTQIIPDDLFSSRFKVSPSDHVILNSNSFNFQKESSPSSSNNVSPSLSSASNYITSEYFVFLYHNKKQPNSTIYTQNTRETLLSFEVVDQDSSSSSNSNNGNGIYISSTLANKLNIQLQDQVHCKLIKRENTALQRVVLLANDVQSFTESSTKQEITSTITKHIANESFRKVLVDSSILFSNSTNIEIPSFTLPTNILSYKVLECYPLSQGTALNTTTIIIVSPDDQINKVDIKQEEEQEEQEEKVKVKVVEKDKQSSNNTKSTTLRLSNFIIHPIISTMSTSSDVFHFTPSSRGILSNNKRNIPVNQLKLIPKEYEVLIDGQYDYETDALVTMDTLKSLNLFNGSWVKIQYTDSSQEEHWICVRVFSIPLELLSNDNVDVVDGSVYLPPLSIFNLGFSKSDFLQMMNFNSNNNNQITTIEIEISMLKGNVEQTGVNGYISQQDAFNMFPVASRIKISRIKSQSSSGYESYAHQLQAYFAKKRIVKVGDIFSISKNIQDPNQSFADMSAPDITSSAKNGNDSDLVYFKIESIITNESTNTATPIQLFVIDKAATSIIQEGSSHSLIPSAVSIFSNRLDYPVPIGNVYQKEFKHIVDLILPFLQNNFNFDFNCTLLVHGPKGVGKRTLLEQVCDFLGIHKYEIDCNDIYDFVESKKEDNLIQVLEKASESAPLLLILKNIEVLEQSPQSMQQEKKESNICQILKDTLQQINEQSPISSDNKWNQYPFIISATVNSLDDLGGKLRSWFKHEIQLDAPDETQRFKILKHLFKNIPYNSNSISLKNISVRTASFLSSNLKSLLQRSSINSLKRVLKIQESFNYKIGASEIFNCGFLMIQEDINQSLSEMQDYQSSSIGAPKIPNVTWDDVGGLAHVKSEIMDTIQLPLEHPHLFASGIGKRSGILLYGPPGTGKTLLAKAIATECALNFLSVKGPELINMYIGESEKNIREIFNKARQAKPCVIFFDELDSLAPSRGNGADSGGVMDRVVSQLLAELDGMGKSSDVFIIGATNRPDLLDSSLMRPGRLDRLLYLGISTDKDNQFKICQALSRKFNLADDVDLRQVVESCPMNLTGADFYALNSDALANAMKDRIQQLEAKYKDKKSTDVDINEDEGTNEKLIVYQKHYIQAVDSLVPSVSKEELEYYHKVQNQFSSKKK
ncbi:hypothetical protein CYY_001949 [Polysphondylium violaceum]|uniref:Peroxisomal ATPase PEX6 n=1 Tax=Polysphondylium violaceum TaxID=133409 RepID=A0A8J4Q095_9MYCE|nr:hypothetical protein CYY_001949 [Polysphondylium violaceum]